MPHNIIPCSHCQSNEILKTATIKDDIIIFCPNNHKTLYDKTNLTLAAKSRIHGSISCNSIAAKCQPTETDIECKNASFKYQRTDGLCSQAFWTRVGLQNLSCPNCNNPNHNPYSAHFIKKKPHQPEAMLRMRYHKNNEICDNKSHSKDIFIGALSDEDKQKLVSLNFLPENEVYS